MTVITSFRKIALACVALGSLASLRAEIIYQIATSDATSIQSTSGWDWKTIEIWGDGVTPLSSATDYQTVVNTAKYASGIPYGTDLTTSTVDGYTKAWAYYAQVRDINGNPTSVGNLSFGGKSLIVASNTRFLSKNRINTTTANWVLQDNSYLYLSPTSGSGSGTGTATFAGTISTTGDTLIGFETISAKPQGFTVAADISGDGVLTLAGKGGDAAVMSLTGNLDLFTGTFLLTVTAAKTAGTLTFSIASSAVDATLQLDWASSALFVYDLSTNDVSFNSLILGVGGYAEVLDPGTYTADDLNALTGDAGIFLGTGTITVVPEPSTCALVGMGLLGGLAALRSRRK